MKDENLIERPGHKIIQPSKEVLNLTVNYDKLFFGESGHGVARYDIVRYPILAKLNIKMQNFFWRPEKISMVGEKASFESLTKAEQHVFTSNLSRQIILDTVQGRAPSLAFLPICSDPTLENCITTWTFFETIHSESYTRIIRAIYPDPSVVINNIIKVKEIADCATSITQAYENLIQTPNKKNLYLALVAANALEAIRFYVSFACTFSFMERGKVEASGKLVELIARDEIEHLALVQHIIKLLPQDDPEFIEIIKDCKEEALHIFLEAAEQEKEWARYLFQDGPIIGLNEKILCDYVDYLTLRRTRAINLSADVSYRGNHPIPWIEKHLSSSIKQVALQDAESIAYLDPSSLINDLSTTDLNKYIF